MGKTFEELLAQMPEIADAVNAFESEAAQLRALDALLEVAPEPGNSSEDPGEKGPRSTDDPSGGSKTEPSDSDGGDKPTWMSELVRGLPGEHLVVTKGSREQQLMWGLIRMVDSEEEATEKNIRKLLDESMGVQVNRTQASSKLKGLVPRYANRVKVGRSYAYRPKPTALDIFKGLGGDSE